jgi:hypothetical protein
VYFDSLTIVSMVIFAIAFGSFVYACIIRSCITNDDASARGKRSRDSKDSRQRGGAE